MSENIKEGIRLESCLLVSVIFMFRDLQLPRVSLDRLQAAHMLTSLR